MSVSKLDLYPDYTGYIDYIDQHGISSDILNKIIQKHEGNLTHTKELYDRYKTLEDGVPIFSRTPRFTVEDENGKDMQTINNKVNNDFFSEIVDIKTGYFAGKAATYNYSSTDESEDDTGGDEAVDEAAKALSDFVARNNMYDINMEATKFAAIGGYAGRLFYIDTEGNERVMSTPPYESIFLAKREITEPDYSIRYIKTEDINGVEYCKAEFYDSRMIYFFEGQKGSLTAKGSQPHLFDYNPFQGVPNNKELLGDAEKVLALIDAYDKGVSDNSNDVEDNTNAHMVFQNVLISDPEMAKARKSGAFRFNGTEYSKVYYLTKDVNDGFNEHHLERLEKNIYRFSKTPNFNDVNIATTSGIALKYKLTSLETRCGTFEAKMKSADTYMFKVLASSFQKRGITFDYLQAYAEYRRNFPVDVASEAQVVGALINAGVPEEVAYTQLSFVDDIDYVMDLVEQRKEENASLFKTTGGDGQEDDAEGDEDDSEEIRKPAE